MKPCSSAFVHRSCLLRWQSQQMLSVASEGRRADIASTGDEPLVALRVQGSSAFVIAAAR